MLTVLSFLPVTVSFKLDLHLIRLKEEGFLEEAWEEYLAKEATVDCDDPLTVEGSIGDDVSNEQLTLKNMGGIFFFHALLSILAVLIALVYRVTGWDQIPRFAKGTSIISCKKEMLHRWFH